MNERLFEDLRVPPADPERVWELFHENSKLDPFDPHPTTEQVFAHMADLYEVLPYDGVPVVPLPPPAIRTGVDLADAVTRRESARAMSPRSLPLGDLSTILHLAAGITRDLRAAGFPRAFRAAPSGGALYPFELYVAASRVDGLDSGIWHYHPHHHRLEQVELGEPAWLVPLVTQPEVVAEAGAVVLLTAVFQRSTYKYGDRGYRLVLIEAGHIAQNLGLAATALGHASLPVGGFRDRLLDDRLGLDGLDHATVYLVAIGGPAARAGAAG